MIAAIEQNLQRGIKLLTTISDDEYANNTIPPYFSSIGCHVRHILDVFSCVLNGFDDKKIDLTLRERNEYIELKTASGIAYFELILQKIKLLSNDDLQTEVIITDDLGKGKVSSKSTLGAVLMQTQSHAIHHFASVGYIVNQLNIELPDSDFGYNPSTPKKVEN
ncbi:hypothetical protein BW723_10675 [Polaribacter reichenbachii]|uniref:Damage-inducible protein DinB n=1 Tax=Polaribacter reichenbachii TaxID=996801 RepID=A0A1B8TQG0_9FLAO|nr:DinB family protein [Polaribacter reichenbachii]APZ48126.1 hypothetical protein BW723_10675 [Polaribacter reichenbachii]AUC20393.1 hypothetical protein BTO17_01120 [Polaribacter reichenbachii]OBY61812.1 hypothetical protein LPB301_17080 [Polaribacter reichenbachii]